MKAGDRTRSTGPGGKALTRWIEIGDLPWAAARIARTAVERARPVILREISEADPKRLEVARRNIRSTLEGDPSFPDLEAIVRRHRDFLEFRAPVPGTRGFRRAQSWPVDGREHLDYALAGGRGAILATAHLGWWLLVAPVLRLHGFPVVQTGGPYFERRRAARTDRSGRQSRFRRFIDARTSTPGYLGPNDIAVTLDVRPMFDALSRNWPILIAGDGKRSLEFAPSLLLGREYPLAVGFMKIAMAARCPVLPVFALEDAHPGRIRVSIRPPLPVERTASAVANVAEYARVLDDQIRKTPHLWTRWGIPDLFEQRRAWVANAYLIDSREYPAEEPPGRVGDEGDQAPHDQV